MRLGLLRQGQIMLRVGGADRGFLAADGQPLQPVLANRLQHAEARVWAGRTQG